MVLDLGICGQASHGPLRCGKHQGEGQEGRERPMAIVSVECVCVCAFMMSRNVKKCRTLYAHPCQGKEGKGEGKDEEPQESSGKTRPC